MISFLANRQASEMVIRLQTLIFAEFSMISVFRTRNKWVFNDWISADFDISGMSSGQMVYGATQIWEVTVHYE